MSSASIQLPVAEGRGSVSDVPSLPDGFTDTFSSRFVDIGELRLHAVIGGEGPPLSPLEYVLVGTVLLAWLVFEVWFFFYSSSPIDGRSGRG